MIRVPVVVVECNCCDVTAELELEQDDDGWHIPVAPLRADGWRISEVWEFALCPGCSVREGDAGWLQKLDQARLGATNSEAVKE